jgi:molybdopterin-guanine dinucleotide biosynthesis protein A
VLTTLILAAGESKRFGGVPKQLLEVTDGVQMWEKSIDNLTHRAAVVALFQEKHRGRVRKRYREATDVYINPTRGQAETLSEGLRFLSLVRTKLDQELLVVNCDNGFGPHVLDDLVSSGRCTGQPTAVTFRATPDEENRFSFVDGHPTFYSAQEKQAVSNFALAGAYYFPSRDDLRFALDEVLGQTRGEPYISHVYEHILGPKTSCNINRTHWYDWGTPAALENWRSQ